MEKQALLEDIAIGNQSHGERLSEIEQEEERLIVRSTNWKPSTVRS
jgi:type VI secretion system protein VasG